ncbi:MAG: hypothetical protein Q9M11_01595, partial [Mariprofundaceae bacterium]|nr:hypothetical protein [Mariprofundaceae bacterium]
MLQASSNKSASVASWLKGLMYRSSSLKLAYELHGHPREFVLKTDVTHFVTKMNHPMILGSKFGILWKCGGWRPPGRKKERRKTHQHSKKKKKKENPPKTKKK